jgi:hypothetical protein
MFEYALNPASGLHVKEVQAALVFEYQSPSAFTTIPDNSTKGYYDRSTTPWTYHPTLSLDGFDASASTIRYRTDYFNINCFSGQVFNIETRNTNDIETTDNITHVYLKMMFSLEKNSGTGQNILLVQTYDITSGINHLDWDQIRGVQFPPDANTPNYNIKPESVSNTCGGSANFQPSSFATISAICNSDNYRNKHINTRTETLETPAVQKATKEVTGVVYPNPASDMVSLKTNFPVGRIQVAVMDITGRRIDAIEYEVNQTGAGSLMKINVKKLPAGIYFVEVNGTDGKPVTYKFVKE